MESRESKKQERLKRRQGGQHWSERAKEVEERDWIVNDVMVGKKNKERYEAVKNSVKY